MSSPLDFDRQFFTNRLEIVEWLDPGEQRTGRALYEHLMRPEVYDAIPETPSGPFQILYTAPASRTEFLSRIQAIAEASSIERLPILHIESHGSVNGITPSLDSTEFIAWQDLSAAIRTLNIGCRNNLVVVTAACYGFASFQIGTSQFGDPCPYFLTIGPEEAAWSSELALGLRVFYDTYFRTLEFHTAADAAQAHMEPRLLFMSAERLFFYAASHVQVVQSMPGAVEESLDRLEANGVPSEQRAAARTMLLNSYQEWQDDYATFMHHDWPENQSRFAFDPAMLEGHARVLRRQLRCQRLVCVRCGKIQTNRRGRRRRCLKCRRRALKYWFPDVGG